MRKELLYVEQIVDTSHTGPAWIGYGQFNRSGRTIYFDGKVLGRGRGVTGNHYDIDSEEEYWVSGIKKNGQDRHWAGHGKIRIDKSAAREYLEITQENELSKNKFILVELNNHPNKELAREIENIKISPR